MMLAGTDQLGRLPAVNPIYEICAFGFGVGIGLTIDESRSGSTSTTCLGQGRAELDRRDRHRRCFLGLILIGTRPFDVGTDSHLAMRRDVHPARAQLGGARAAGPRPPPRRRRLFLSRLALCELRVAEPRSRSGQRLLGQSAIHAGGEGRGPLSDRTGARHGSTDRPVHDIIGGSPEEVYLAKIERHEGGGGPVPYAGPCVAGRTRSRLRERVRAAASVWACRTRAPPRPSQREAAEIDPQRLLDWTGSTAVVEFKSSGTAAPSRAARCRVTARGCA